MGVPHPLVALRSIRRARHISVAAIAAVINVAPTSYLRFETGARRIYFDKVVRLADKLGVRTDDFTTMLDEQAALYLCDRRDKEAIAAGTFKATLWPDASERVPAPPSSVPAPPVERVPPPPPSGGPSLPIIEQPDGSAVATRSPEEDVDAILDGWDGEQ